MNPRHGLSKEQERYDKQALASCPIRMNGRRRKRRSARLTNMLWLWLWLCFALLRSNLLAVACPPSSTTVPHHCFWGVLNAVIYGQITLEWVLKPAPTGQLTMLSFCLKQPSAVPLRRASLE